MLNCKPGGLRDKIRTLLSEGLTRPQVLRTMMAEGFKEGTIRSYFTSEDMATDRAGEQMERARNYQACDDHLADLHREHPWGAKYGQRTL